MSLVHNCFYSNVDLNLESLSLGLVLPIFCDFEIDLFLYMTGVAS